MKKNSPKPAKKHPWKVWRPGYLSRDPTVSDSDRTGSERKGGRIR